jgi:phosphoribosyl 1,2-cyclic phosphodiesterase
MEESLAELCVEPSALSAVLVTHEHVDHIRALQLKRPFPDKYSVRVFAPRLFWQTAPGVDAVSNSLRVSFSREEVMPIGIFEVTPMRKPHDSLVSVGFRIDVKGGPSAVVLTDLGEVPDEVIGLSRGANYIVIESNHDRNMELASGRPSSLINRVLSNWGHLSNEQAGQALRGIVDVNTRGVMLAHLSLDCNTPRLALSTVAPYLRQSGFSGVLEVASPDGVTLLCDTEPDW